MKYMVVYDTEDDYIRGQIRETLKDMGGDHVQLSAFIISLTEEQLLQLIRKIQQIIYGSKTDVRIIPLCKKDVEKIEVYTTSVIEEEMDVI